MLYHQSVHNNLKTKKERKHISNLIKFFHFQHFHFWVGSHYPDPILFKQTFFAKKKTLSLFFITFNMTFFYQHLLFQTCQFFHSTLKNIFSIFQENEYDTYFLIFRLFIHFFFTQSKTLSYYEKGTEWKTPFCTFPRIQNTIFVLTRVNFFSNFNDVIKFINIKQDLFF